MHTRPLFLVLLACISMLGCKKQKKTEFEITGLKDIDIRYTEIQSIPISVAYTSGDKQLVTLSVEGLPPGALISFIPNSNVLPYNTKIQVSTRDVAGGDYTLKLIAKPEEGTPRTYSIKMKVHSMEEVGCTGEVAGVYYGPLVTQTWCYMSKPYLKPAAEKSRVIFTSCEPRDFYADLDCNAHTLNIPRQRTPTALYVHGNGTYNGHTVSVYLVIEDSVGNVRARPVFKLEKPNIVY